MEDWEDCCPPDHFWLLEWHACSTPHHSRTWVSPVSQEYPPAKALSSEWRDEKREQDCQLRLEFRNPARTACCKWENEMRTLGPHQSREHQEVEEELFVEPSTDSSVAVGWNNSERNEDGTYQFLMASLGTSSVFYSTGPSRFQQDHNRWFQPLPLFSYIVLELLCLHSPCPSNNHFRLNSCFTAFFLPSNCVTGWHIVLPVCGGIRSEVRSICMSRGKTDSNFFCLCWHTNNDILLEIRPCPTSGSRWDWDLGPFLGLCLREIAGFVG